MKNVWKCEYLGQNVFSCKKHYRYTPKYTFLTWTMAYIVIIDSQIIASKSRYKMKINVIRKLWYLIKLLFLWDYICCCWFYNAYLIESMKTIEEVKMSFSVKFDYLVEVFDHMWTYLNDARTEKLLIHWWISWLYI